MKTTKTVLTMLCMPVLCMVMCVGCGNQTAEFDSTAEIGVISREEGSGTRSAFVELFGIEQKNTEGVKEDQTLLSAVICKSTGVMMTTVAGDMYAVGYTSLGALNDTVKVVAIDGVEPTAVNVQSGAYTVSRPFNIAAKGDLSAVAQDFVTYILSADGQAVIKQEGYVPVSDASVYAGGGVSGKIVISGSSSVTPIMEKLKEAYLAHNPAVTIELQESDSSSGMTDAADGTADIGMASRELKESELEKGLVPTTIATDGIAVIVNNNNPVNSLTTEQVKALYIGEVTTWDGIIGD